MCAVQIQSTILNDGQVGSEVADVCEVQPPNHVSGLTAQLNERSSGCGHAGGPRNRLFVRARRKSMMESARGSSSPATMTRISTSAILLGAGRKRFPLVQCHVEFPATVKVFGWGVL